MRGFLALTWVELKLFLRDPFATVLAVVFPLIALLLLAAVFGDTPPDDEVDGRLVFRGIAGDDYYVGASVGLVIAAIGLLTLPVHLASYREQGILRRFRASSIPAWALLASQAVVGLVIAIVGSSLMALVAGAVYGTQLPDSLPGVLVAIVIASLCFTAIGFLLAAIIPTARAAQGIGLILYFSAWMTSGAGPPLAVLPDTVRNVGGQQPLARAIIAVQDAWFGFGWNWTEMLILAGIAAVATLPAVWLFRWD
jgi:ABC-2 type transport system permease protein